MNGGKDGGVYTAGHLFYSRVSSHSMRQAKVVNCSLSKLRSGLTLPMAYVARDRYARETVLLRDQCTWIRLLLFVYGLFER